MGRHFVNPSYILFDAALLKEPMSLPVEFYTGMRYLYTVVLISGEVEDKKDEVVDVLVDSVGLAYAMPVFCPAGEVVLGPGREGAVFAAGRAAIARIGYNPDFVVLDKNEEYWRAAGIRVVKLL
jgi:hypothetical protein